MQTSLAICSLIYITDQVKCLHVWCRQSGRYVKRYAQGGTMLGREIIFTKPSKGVALIEVDDFVL